MGEVQRDLGALVAQVQDGQALEEELAEDDPLVEALDQAEADPAVMADLEPGLDIPDFETRMSSVGPAGAAAIEGCKG